MKSHRSGPLFVLALFILGTITMGSYSKPAYGRYGLTGWELDSKYQKYFDPKKLDFFKGTVEAVATVEPMPGMDPGVAIMVRTKGNRLVEVQMGPKSFVDISVIGLKKGDSVKCIGVRAKINKKDVFIASKVKKGEYTQIKLRRTSDGVPFWAMTLAELSEFTAEFAPEEGIRPGMVPKWYRMESPLEHQIKKSKRILEDRVPTAE